MTINERNSLEQARFLEASQAVKSHPKSLIDLSQYDLTEQHCFEVIRNSGLAIKEATAYIQPNGLTPEHRLELAAIFMHTDPYFVLKNLDKFNLLPADQ